MLGVKSWRMSCKMYVLLVRLIKFYDVHCVSK